MDQATLWLSLLMMAVMTILIAPPVLRMNQGKIIRNTAIWLAVVVGLALVYRVFGPFEMAGQPLPVRSQGQEKPANSSESKERPQLDETREPEAPRPSSKDNYTPPDE
jgi:hypothetical protein